MGSMSQTPREPEIRAALRAYVAKEHAVEAHTLIVEELALCQSASRIDLVAVNGNLHGYEIKSARDTLQRLAGQAQAYRRVFDTVTLVLAGRHTAEARGMVPHWWGLVEVTGDRHRIQLRRKRKSRPNLCVDPRALVQFLWRSEALAILHERHLDGGLRTKPKPALWNTLVRSLTTEQLRTCVREALKSRERWRLGSRRASGGGSCQRRARSLHFQGPLRQNRTG